MATAVFDPSLSASAMRAPFASADAPSMADSLPSINFGFDDLRHRMAAFQSRFDEFIEQGRKRVMEERNQFRMNITEMKGRHRIYGYRGYNTGLSIRLQRTNATRSGKSRF